MYHLVDTETPHTGAEEILVEIIDKFIDGDHETILGMSTEETVLKNRSIETGVEVETITGILIEIEKLLGMIICKVEIIVEIEVGQDNHAPSLEKKGKGTEIG